MKNAYLAIGSNLGDRLNYLTQAVRRLRAEPGLRVVRVSPWYETAPVGGPNNQGPYLNGAIHVETDRGPRELLKFLHEVEAQFGRVRTVQDGPRTLDLDLLIYDDVVIHDAEMVVPHPRMHTRPFVLVPLCDIAAEVVHPVFKQSVQQLLQKLQPIPESDLKPFTSQVLQKLQDLSGMTALVTGSTSGIGLCIATELQQRGASVIHHGRRKLQNVQHSVSADLNDVEQVDDLAEQAWNLYQGLDILICNAGADTLTGDAAKWSFDRKLEALLNVDLKATMRLSRTIGERMRLRGKGVILTVGWDQAETGLEGDSGQLFAAVKGAIMCFTRSLALSLAPQVRVNCLAPGWIRTAWGETASPVWQDRVRRETPLGVWGLPEDIAQAAAWLCSPQASFITGQTIRLNGGALRA